MKLFDPRAHTRSESSRRIYALCEIVHTFVDFSAALLFLVGSILFFNEDTVYFATWLFVIGSIFFALKPTIRLVREVALYRDGQVDLLADRLNE